MQNISSVPRIVFIVSLLWGFRRGGLGEFQEEGVGHLNRIRRNHFHHPGITFWVARRVQSTTKCFIQKLRYHRLNKFFARGHVSMFSFRVGMEGAGRRTRVW